MGYMGILLVLYPKPYSTCMSRGTIRGVHRVLESAIMGPGRAGTAAKSSKHPAKKGVAKHGEIWYCSKA